MYYPPSLAQIGSIGLQAGIGAATTAARVALQGPGKQRVQISSYPVTWEPIRIPIRITEIPSILSKEALFTLNAMVIINILCIYFIMLSVFNKVNLDKISASV